MSEKQRVLVYGMSDNPGGIETYLRNLTKELAPEIILDFVTDFPGVAYEEELKVMALGFIILEPKVRDC